MAAPDITGTILSSNGTGATMDTSTVQSTCVDPVYGLPVDCSTGQSSANVCIDNTTGLPVDCSTLLPLTSPNAPQITICPDGYVCDQNGNIIGTAPNSLPCLAGVGPLAPGQSYCAGVVTASSGTGGTTSAPAGVGTTGAGISQTSGLGSIASGIGNLLGGIIHAVTGTGVPASQAAAAGARPGTVGGTTQASLLSGTSGGLILVLGLILVFALAKHKGRGR